MSTEQNIARFQVELSDDILKDISAPEKLFKSESLKAEVREGDNTHVERTCSVQLERVGEGGRVKLLVTVHTKKDTDEPVSQSAPDTSTSQDSDTSQQAKVEEQVKDTPPLPPPPPPKTFEDVSIQTEEKKLEDCVTQTEQKVIVNMNIQTDPTPIDHEYIQTDSADLTDQLSQTDSPRLEESQVQATVATNIGIMQTDILEYGSSHMQTDMSMALQTEQDSQTYILVEDVVSQTEVDITDATIQTERNESHAVIQTDAPKLDTVVSQTDMSLANQVEQETQVVVTVAHKISQIAAQNRHQKSQTASSMALQTDAESQADTPTLDTSHVQTDEVDTQHGSMQTDVVETGEQDSQTEEVEEKAPAVQVDEAIPEDLPHLQAVEGGAVQLTENGLDAMPVPDDLSQQAGSENLAKAKAILISPDKFEAESQTDPVTIIIGDASFLVKKLKSSAASPSKVSSSGNEIEIEVNADGEGMDVYRSGSRRYGNRYGTPRQSTGGTGDGTPRRGGARVRMPVQRTPGARGGSSRSSYGRGRTSSGGGVMAGSPQTGSGGGEGSQGGYGAGLGKYNCPFCPLMFEESPALYEHIQDGHQDQRGLIKKPKGREGKTIIPRRREPESEPPVLTPMVNLAVQQEDGTYAEGETEAIVQVVQVVQGQQEGGLFEDPVEQPSVNRRGQAGPALVRLEGTQEVVQVVQHVTPTEDDVAFAQQMVQQQEEEGEVEDQEAALTEQQLEEHEEEEEEDEDVEEYEEEEGEEEEEEEDIAPTPGKRKRQSGGAADGQGKRRRQTEEEESPSGQKGRRTRHSLGSDKPGAEAKSRGTRSTGRPRGRGRGGRK